MNTIIALDDRWICISPESVRIVNPYTPLGAPSCIVWLTSHTTGEMTLQGSKSHAAALIERRELTSGSIDPESKVFIHSICPVDAAYQAAYSIASLSAWLAIVGWAKNQPNHSVISNATALAWSVITPGQAVVVQDGLTLTFWAVVNERIIHCSLVAMGPDAEDIRFAAEALGHRVHAALSKSGESNTGEGTVGSSVKWLSVMRRHMELEHAAALSAFKDAAILEVASVDSLYDTRSDLGVIASAMPQLALNLSPKSFIGPPGGRLLLRAEKALPVCSLLSIIFSLGFVCLTVYWLVQANQIERDTQAKLAGLALKQPVSIEAAQKSQEAIELEAQLSFISAIGQLQNGYDLENILQALKFSVRGGMRILGVRSIAEADLKKNAKAPAAVRVGPRAFIVDGALPDSSSYDVLLSQFIWSLNQSGYTTEAIDVPSSAAASSTSIRLFSYRVRPTHPR